MPWPCFRAQARCLEVSHVSGLLLACFALLWLACVWPVACTGAALYARAGCSWLASGLLLACFVWRASCLPLAVFLDRRGGLCTSGLLCLACFWLALSGLCCLGLACCARATARKSFIFDRTARGVRTFPDKSSAPRPVFAQLPLQFTANLKRHPCNLQVKMDVFFRKPK